MSVLRMNIKRYVGKSHETRDFFVKGFKIDYIARNSAVLKFSEPIDKSSLSFTDDLRLKRKQNMNDTSSGLFKMSENNKALEISKYSAKQDFNKVEDQIIWDGEITISEETANKLKFGELPDWTELTEKFIPAFLKKENFSPENMNFYFSVHANTKNPHLHFIFFEKEKSVLSDDGTLSFRKKGKINLENIRTFERVVGGWMNNKDFYRQDFEAKQKLWSDKLDSKNIIKNNYIFELNNSINSVIEESKRRSIKTFNRLSEDSKSKIWNYFEKELNEFDLKDKEKISSFINSVNKVPKTKKEAEFLENEKKGFYNDVGNFVFKSLLAANFEINNSQIKNTNDFNFKSSVNDISANLIKLSRKATLNSLKTHLSKYDWKQKQEALQKFNDMGLGLGE